MKYENQDKDTTMHVENMGKRGVIFRSLRIVDIKHPRAMLSWCMNRIICGTMLAVEITKQVMNVNGTYTRVHGNERDIQIIFS
jgi:hypothetical protein